MIVNFRACGISRGACKLTRTPMLIKKRTYYYHLMVSGSNFVVANMMVAEDLHDR